MVKEFILYNNPDGFLKEKRGVRWTEQEILKLIKICYLRNTTIYNKLVSDYEFLTGENFKIEWIKNI